MLDPNEISETAHDGVRAATSTPGGIAGGAAHVLMPSVHGSPEHFANWRLFVAAEGGLAAKKRDLS